MLFIVFKRDDKFHLKLWRLGVMRESSLSSAMKQDYTKGCKPCHHEIVLIVFV